MSYICENCGKVVEDKDKFGSGRFCCRACANGHKHSDEWKAKISAGVNKKTECECQFCGRKFDNLTAKASHERLCKDNPNRIENAGAQARKKYTPNTKYKAKNGDILDVTKEAVQNYLDEHKTCEICGKTVEESIHWDSKFSPKRLCVDHDHKTLKFRGVLCSQCNRQLGWYEQYQEEIEAYLKK